MTKERAKQLRNKMKEMGIKHYIYAIKCMAGTLKEVAIVCKDDECFENEATKILSDKWNTEILAIHLF